MGGEAEGCVVRGMERCRGIDSCNIDTEKFVNVLAMGSYHRHSMVIAHCAIVNSLDYKRKSVSSRSASSTPAFVQQQSIPSCMHGPSFLRRP